MSQSEDQIALKEFDSRWNPLEPDAPWESISPYFPLKERESDKINKRLMRWKNLFFLFIVAV